MSLQDYRADMDRCSQCSYCKWIPFDHVKSWRFAKGCPSIAYNNFQSYSARGRYAVALSILEGKSGYSDAVKDVVYKCQTCGLCDVSCKVCRYNLEPLETALEFRAKLVGDGQTLEPHVLLITNLKKEHNLLGKSHLERGKWAEELSVKDLTREKADVAFFVGCRFSYDIDLAPTARTAIKVLKKAGLDIGILGNEEICCGGRAYQMGYRKEFSECAEKNITALSNAGVKMIITSCADCYQAFRRLYPRLGSQFEVIHTIEAMDRLLKEGRLLFSRNVPMIITYHDPCHLGRQGEAYVPWNGRETKIRGQIVIYEPPKPRYNGAGGIYDPPRNVLKNIPGIKLVEMERIREYAWCCGAGGGVREAYPEFSLWTASERIEEARSTGAEAIVTSCPWCERNFRDAIESQGIGMKVFDVMDLIHQAI